MISTIQYICSYPNCGQKFPSNRRLLLHENLTQDRIFDNFKKKNLYTTAIAAWMAKRNIAELIGF